MLVDLLRPTAWDEVSGVALIDLLRFRLLFGLQSFFLLNHPLPDSRGTVDRRGPRPVAGREPALLLTAKVGTNNVSSSHGTRGRKGAGNRRCLPSTEIGILIPFALCRVPAPAHKSHKR